MTRGKKNDDDSSNDRDYETMRVSTLRNKLHEKVWILMAPGKL